ncbi:MAG TPA: HIT domain-containing protein [Syntrophales bacterium]|nr:HIT domain-containing protein [Syntrophales bacterium]
MEKIYAPWRMEFIRSEKPDGCIFCRESLRKDDLVLFEGKTAFVMANRYPYISGHLMIIPYRHVNQLEDLTDEEKLEIFNLQDMSIRVLKKAMNPEGFNIGMNLGKAAGAGIDDHIHVHIVPRWHGDANFMSVVGEVRVIPEDIHKTCEMLLPHFRKYHPEV